jgi:hypothetical protein
VAVRIKIGMVLSTCYRRTLAHFGHDAQRIDGLTGVWVNGAKLAAVGVKVCHAAHHMKLLDTALISVQRCCRCCVECAFACYTVACKTRPLEVVHLAL